MSKELLDYFDFVFILQQFLPTHSNVQKYYQKHLNIFLIYSHKKICQSQIHLKVIDL